MNATARDLDDADAEPFFARRARLDAYRHLGSNSLGRSELAASWVRRDQPGLGLTLPNPRSDTFLASVFFSGLNAGDIWCDERHIRRGNIPVGGLAIVDQRHSWVADVTEPFESVHVFIPQRALDELTDELRAPRVEALVCPVQSPQLDPVMLHLGQALQAGLARPTEASTLFAEHVFAAMCVHLAETYGGVTAPQDKAFGGLAPWQERRAKAMLLDDLQADCSLSELAEACGMSVRHLGRAFKATTGLPPHRWLLRRRVDRAKELLERTDQSLTAVALACGFADQSHLTRVFQALAGSSPGAWRRQRRT
jgi:AraC family transcriptional regulator